MKEYARKFYQSKEWQKARADYLQTVDNLCERCDLEDKLSLAEIVHHKIYITKENINNTAITLDSSNLEALCLDCHNKEHIARRPPRRYKFDANGEVISTAGGASKAYPPI